MMHNRTWLAFANESICNHRKALKQSDKKKNEWKFYLSVEINYFCHSISLGASCTVFENIKNKT